jgi:hypothetical protein
MVDGSQIIKGDTVVRCFGPEVQLGNWSISANADIIAKIDPSGSTRSTPQMHSPM